jgi:hypothetical protein
VHGNHRMHEARASATETPVLHRAVKFKFD